jgi:hypothetical protein
MKVVVGIMEDWMASVSILMKYQYARRHVKERHIIADPPMGRK